MNRLWERCKDALCDETIRQNYIEKQREFIYTENLLSVKVKLTRKEFTMVDSHLSKPDFEIETDVLSMILQEAVKFDKANVCNS